QSGLSTTEPGLIERKPAPSRRSMWIIAVVGLLIGIALVFVLTREPGPATSASASAINANAEPSGLVSSQQRAGPSTDPAPADPPAPPPATAGAAVATSRVVSTSAPATHHANEPARVRPGTSAAPAAPATASVAAQPTTRPFTDFGDRK